MGIRFFAWLLVVFTLILNATGVPGISGGAYAWIEFLNSILYWYDSYYRRPIKDSVGSLGIPFVETFVGLVGFFCDIVFVWAGFIIAHFFWYVFEYRTYWRALDADIKKSAAMSKRIKEWERLKDYHEARALQREQHNDWTGAKYANMIRAAKVYSKYWWLGPINFLLGIFTFGRNLLSFLRQEDYGYSASDIGWNKRKRYGHPDLLAGQAYLTFSIYFFTAVLVVVFVICQFFGLRYS